MREKCKSADTGGNSLLCRTQKSYFPNELSRSDHTLSSSYSMMYAYKKSSDLKFIYYIFFWFKH